MLDAQLEEEPPWQTWLMTRSGGCPVGVFSPPRRSEVLPWPGARVDEAEATTEATARRLAAAALEAWAAAAEDARSVAAEAVTAALKGPARATRIGAIHFDAKGDAAVPAFVPHVWESGRWQSWR